MNDLEKRVAILEAENELLKSKTEKKFVRAKELAKMFSIGLSTVWLYESQGILTSRKLSARVTLFSVDEMENLLFNIPVDRKPVPMHDK